ncbi:F0F1 ATP synthase subunit delta [Hydrogenimonas sp.]
MDRLIAKRYVKALIEAVGDKKIEEAAKALEGLAKAFDEPKFRQIIVSPEIKKEKREELILSILGKKADKRLVNFVKTLGIHNRFGLIPEISTLLAKELQRRANRYEGVVESAKPIDKKLLEELESSLSKYVDATVVLQPVKSDKDGIRVMIEDLGLEASFSKERVASDMINHILKAL